jgi:NAD-dependent DNA ligase
MEIYPPYDLSTIDQILLEQHTKWKERFPIDGIMIKLKSPHKRLLAAHNNQTYLWSIAWKPPIQTAWTEVIDIEWNVSRAGRLVPRIEYAPVYLCGTLNKHVTGNNARWIAERMLCVGDQILIGKAGEIIPQVLKVNNKSDELVELHPVGIPPRCPMCSSIVTWQGRDLICTFSECMGKFVKQLHHFYDKAGVALKGFKERRFSELLRNKNIYETLKKSPWALLDPHTFNILNDIYNVFGEKITDQYLSELDIINDSHDPSIFISAMGYPGIGRNISRKLFALYSNDANDSGIPVEFITGLHAFDRAKLELKNFSFLPMPSKPVLHYTITGELSARREDIIKYLTKHKWQFQNTVSYKTSILILGDLKHRTSTTKLHGAREKNIPIINEDQLDAVVKAVNEQQLNKEKT